MEPVDAVGAVPAEYLRTWATTIFSRLGLPAADAQLVAETLVISSLRGVDSHGIMRIPVYAERLRRGGINPQPRLTVPQETAGTAVVDGDNGMGQVVARYAMEVALQKARESGTSFVLARHTNHFGAAGYWAEMALGQDMIGWATTNTPPIVAPWGSKQALIGNNPLAIAVPAAGDPPLVLDMAMSMVAGGKLRYAARRGEPIPDDWALDPDGWPTTDPNAGLAGVLLPMGKHKGSGLSIMIETLTGLLAGTGWSERVQIVWEEMERPGNVASAFGVINIANFIDPAAFKQAVAAMTGRIQAADRAPGTERVFVPGGPEFDTERERRQRGVPLPAQVMRELQQLGDELSTPFKIPNSDETVSP